MPYWEVPAAIDPRRAHSDSDFDRVFNRMKQVADHNGALGDARIRSIVEEVVSDSQVMQAINQAF